MVREHVHSMLFCTKLLYSKYDGRGAVGAADGTARSLDEDRRDDGGAPSRDHGRVGEPGPRGGDPRASDRAFGREVAMTIDERLERLAERHEALTQSVEMMALENKQRDRRQAEIMEGLASLVHVAEIHEHRIARQ